MARQRGVTSVFDRTDRGELGDGAASKSASFYADPRIKRPALPHVIPLPEPRPAAGAARPVGRREDERLSTRRASGM
jgi:hypothetical protein